MSVVAEIKGVRNKERNVIDHREKDLRAVQSEVVGCFIAIAFILTLKAHFCYLCQRRCEVPYKFQGE